MAYYVYIIQSFKDSSLYKGFTENPLSRLAQYNNRESKYTSMKTPWRLVYVEELSSRKEALIREKNLKKATNERLKALITHTKNIVAQFQ